MEVTLERERERDEEQVVDTTTLQTRRRKSHHTKNTHKPINGADIITSEPSDISFEHFATMSSVMIVNDEKPTFFEAEALMEATFEEPKKIEHDNGISFSTSEGINGLTVKQNGSDLAQSSQGISEGSISEVTEYDVEGVLQKQETHDLFCPKCKADITKRVILKRRKRKHPEVSTSGGDPDNVAEESPENEPDRVDGAPDEPVDAITCLSCFNIFIPTRKGFLCWKFGPKPDITPQPDGGVEAGETVAVETVDDDTGKVFPLWILTCCQPSEGKKPEHPVKPDETVPEHESGPPPTATDGKALPLWILTCCQPYEGNQPEQLENSGEEVLGRDFEPPLAPIDDRPVLPKPELHTTPEATKPLLHKPLSAITPDGDKPVLPKPELPQTAEAKKPLVHKPLSTITPDGEDSLPPGPEPPATPSTENAFPVWILTCCQPSRDGKKLEHSETPGDEVIVSMPGEQPSKPQPEDTPPEAGPETDLERPLLERPTTERVSGVEIIKAIVYGGLLEIITSLGVIASAASGDATTLNIVALGLANVLSGLLVLVHSLRALKNEQTTDRYEETLGRPRHFPLHATIAVISYLIFGLMPPMVYGFSFRKSNDKHLKIATLAAASLVSIVILSIGKAYVQRPPKAYIKTVFYYVAQGFTVSGLGYVAGEQINMLMKKLGWFDSSSSVTMIVPKAGALKGAWSS